MLERKLLFGFETGKIEDSSSQRHYSLEETPLRALACVRTGDQLADRCVLHVQEILGGASPQCYPISGGVGKLIQGFSYSVLSELLFPRMVAANHFSELFSDQLLIMKEIIDKLPSVSLGWTNHLSCEGQIKEAREFLGPWTRIAPRNDAPQWVKQNVSVMQEMWSLFPHMRLRGILSLVKGTISSNSPPNPKAFISLAELERLLMKHLAPILPHDLLRQ